MEQWMAVVHRQTHWELVVAKSKPDSWSIVLESEHWDLFKSAPQMTVVDFNDDSMNPWSIPIPKAMMKGAVRGEEKEHDWLEQGPRVWDPYNVSEGTATNTSVTTEDWQKHVIPEEETMSKDELGAWLHSVGLSPAFVEDHKELEFDLQQVAELERGAGAKRPRQGGVHKGPPPTPQSVAAEDASHTASIGQGSMGGASLSGRGKRPADEIHDPLEHLYKALPDGAEDILDTWEHKRSQGNHLEDAQERALALLKKGKRRSPWGMAASFKKQALREGIQICMEELDEMEVKALQKSMANTTGCDENTLGFLGILGGTVRRDYLLHHSEVTGVELEIRTDHASIELRLVRLRLLRREKEAMGEDTFKKLMQLRQLELDLVKFVRGNRRNAKRRRVSDNDTEEDESEGSSE